MCVSKTKKLVNKHKYKTMKTINLKNMLLLVFGLVVLSSCVEDDDFNTPNLSVQEPELEQNAEFIEIAAVAGDLAQEQGGGALDYTNENTVFTFPTDGIPKYMTGYVISSDEGGNFFEELIIQDNFENPTIGIRILLDVNPIFVRYEVGRKIYVKMNGLTVGIRNGVLSFGGLDGNRVGQIAAPDEEKVIKRSAEVQTIVPLVMEIEEFSDEKTNLYIQLQDVQFNRADVLSDPPKTFASESSDQFDGERALESCATGAATIFSTSTFADYKNLRLPANRGSMDAILTKNFFGDMYNVTVSTPETINFDNEERCDPDFFECTTASGGGATFYLEDFQPYANMAAAEAAGWTNVNVSGGTTRYTLGSFSGTKYAQVSGFNAGASEINVWLVSPGIDMDTTTGEELSFDIQANFDNGTIITVYISNDFTGDPETATWQLLDAVIPTGPSGGFAQSFTTVGPINVSCIDGTAHVGFFYEGSDPAETTRYHITNIRMTGN